MSGRPWPAYVAGALLLGLMLIAYLARGSSGPRQMWLTPARAAAGESVSVRYQEPRTTFGVTLERDGQRYVVSDGELREVASAVPVAGQDVYWTVEAIPPSDASYDLSLPTGMPPGSYRVCAESLPSEFDVTRPGAVHIEELCGFLTVIGSQGR